MFFETGDLSESNGTSLNGATISAVTTYAHHGRWSAVTAGLQSANEYAIVNKNYVPGQATAYGRWYSLVNTTPGNIIALGVFTDNTSTNNLYTLYNPVTSKWGIYNSAIAAFYYETGTTVFNPNFFNCLEMRETISTTTNGVAQLWVNGFPKVDVSGIQTSAAGGTVDNLGVGGILFANEAAERIVASDCVVLADQRIGCELRYLPETHLLNRPHLQAKVFQHGAY